MFGIVNVVAKQPPAYCIIQAAIMRLRTDDDDGSSCRVYSLTRRYRHEILKNKLNEECTRLAEHFMYAGFTNIFNYNVFLCY